LAQAGAEVFWLKGSAVVPSAFAKLRGVARNFGTRQCGNEICRFLNCREIIFLIIFAADKIEF
jgi:hypothetical protein